jgi:hypothetical protein
MDATPDILKKALGIMENVTLAFVEEADVGVIGDC